MKKGIIFLLAGLIPAFFLESAAAQTPKYPGVFVQQVSVNVACVKGGPEMIFEWLLEDYAEKPVHALRIENVAVMYIAENKNTPSSTVILVNERIKQSCVFWNARDFLRTIETESLPAKTPKGEGA